MRTKPYTQSTYWQESTKSEDISQWVTGLAEQLKHAADRADAPLRFQNGPLQIARTANSFWLLYQFATGGRLAIRTCFDPQFITEYKLLRKTKTTAEYQLQGALGQFRVIIELPEGDGALLHYTTTLKPKQSFTVQSFPRDCYLLDKQYNPLTTQGMVYVTQSGPTSGLAYLSLARPQTGSLFYFQNFTALNDYFQVTQTEPTNAVHIQWPEIGFSLPASEQPLEAGKEVTLSDAYLYLSDFVPESEFEAADQFLEAQACIYKHLPKPEIEYYDWPAVAERTTRVLTESPHCGRVIKQQYYLNAYVDATQKPPESMVQLALLVPLWEYREWLEKPVPLVDQLQKNLPSFFDKKYDAFMRWLPGGTFREEDRSEEQDPNKVDSWYLLHTLMNLGRLADKGDVEAKELLFRSLEFAIKAAHEFSYEWPVFYDIRTLEVVKAETAEGKGGELDVAGLFTHVMVQAYELTKDPRYLREAIASAERLRGKGFELLYQTNITIMSALTLAKLWKITGNRLYFDLSRLGVANAMARLWAWECNFGHGQARSTFMGVAPLKDAPYLAAYEEAEIFATILNYLKEVGRDMPDPIRLLLSEYMKYLLHRARYYFPAELPKEMVCEEPREGRTIRELPIPLEDLPTGWKQAGAVGQEVYGGALPAILTTYAYKRFADVPVIIYCEYPIYQADFQLTGKKAGYVVLRLGGTAYGSCRVRLLAKSRTLPTLRLLDEDAPDKPPLQPTKTERTFQEFTVPGHLRLRMEWSLAKKS